MMPRAPQTQIDSLQRPLGDKMDKDGLYQNVGPGSDETFKQSRNEVDLFVIESFGAIAWAPRGWKGESYWKMMLNAFFKTKLCHFAPPSPLGGGGGQNGRAS